MRVCVLREPPEGHWNLSMWRESSRGMTSVSSCHTGPTEAPWSPTVGPIETLHLYPARLSVGKKLTAPWPCWLRASQGQSKWKSQQTASPALRVSDHGHSAMYKDQILAGFPKGVKKKKNRKMRLRGKRHVFIRSDSVVRPWPSLAAEICGTIPQRNAPERRISTASSICSWMIWSLLDLFLLLLLIFLNGFYDRATFQREFVWSLSHATLCATLPNAGFMWSAPADWRWQNNNKGSIPLKFYQFQ